MKEGLHTLSSPFGTTKVFLSSALGSYTPCLLCSIGFFQYLENMQFCLHNMRSVGSESLLHLASPGSGD